MFFAYSTQTVFTSEKDAAPNARLNALQLHQLIIGSDCTTIDTYEQIKSICALHFEIGSDYKTVIKPLIEPLKKSLGYFLPSGYCPVHHNNETLQYNGIVQMDIDIKRIGGSKEAQRIMTAIKSIKHLLPFVVLATMSPTGYGLKILVQTNNKDKATHGEAFRQVAAFLANLLQIQKGDIDTLGISQPCFLPNDPTAYFNEYALSFHVQHTEQENSPKPTHTQNFDADTERTAKAAVFYLTENKIDLDHSYHEFISMVAALVNTFGEEIGKEYAHAIYATSPKYNNESKKYIKDFSKSVARRDHYEKPATAGSIIYHAKKHGFKTIFNDFQTTKNETYTGEKGEYLLQILARYNKELTVKEICNRKWVVPTGTGKSYMVATFAKAHKVVVVCPSNALVNQYVTNGAVGFDETRLKVTNNDTFIAVTYASLAKLGTRINTHEYHLFFDECHNFTSGDFMRKQLHKAATQIRFYQSLTQLTATNLYNFDKRLEIPTVRVTVPKPHKDFHIIDCEHILNSVANLVLTSATKERLPVVLLNNTTTKLAELKTLIGDFKGLHTLSSDDKEKDLFSEITKDKLLPKNLKALITTTVIKEGNDINNEKHFDIFVVGAFHSSDLEQFASRFRKALSITVYHFKSNKRTEKDQAFEVMARAKSVLRSAERSMMERNSELNDMDMDTLTKEQNVRNAIQTQAIKDREDGSGKCEIDSIKINNTVFNDEKYYEYQNDAYQIEQLSQYNFRHIQNIDTTQTDTPTDGTQSEMKEAAKASKTAAKLAYKNCLESILSAANPTFYFRELCNTKLPKAQQKAIDRINALNEKLGVSVKDAATALCTESDGELLTYSDLEFNRFATRAQLQALENNTAYMASNRKLSILIKAMRHALSPGAKYSGEELREIVVGVLSIDKSIDLYPFKASGEKSVKQRIMRIVGFFFDVEYKPMKENGDLSRVYILSKSYSFFNYIGLKSKEKYGTNALEKAVWKAAIDDTTAHLDTNDGWDNVPKKMALKGK